ncbi:phage tail protein [Paenibacillus selenitireducens]|uniref:Phage tail protein n=1 Tax=Paenibacillus selenitireducens TaxID=1324314 RepID=A0A1T2XA25_9BACL|nr:phage major tail tube protein [Paenibacillus selenitireducens]OPA76741.1 phage tail protein [Paenibacillus selenitireducens]
MSRTLIDEKLIDYTTFLEGNTYLGVTSVQLPALEMMSDTLKGAGIAGEIDSITPGHFGPMPIIFNWRTTPTREAVQLMKPKAHLIEFRAAIQVFNKTTSEHDEVGKKITVRAFPKKLDLGKAEAATTMDGSNEMECIYLKVEEDGAVLIEIDKLNNIYVVDGFDYRAKLRNILAL